MYSVGCRPSPVTGIRPGLPPLFMRMVSGRRRRVMMMMMMMRRRTVMMMGVKNPQT